MKFHHRIRKVLPKLVRERVYQGISSSLDRVGFIARVAAGPIDFRGIDIGPAEAIERSAGFPCVIDVAPEHLRNVGPMTGVSYFPCQKGAGNPFVETITQYLGRGRIDYSHSALKFYHDNFQPCSIAEALGLSGDVHSLLEQPPILTFPPWARPPLSDYHLHIKRRQDNIRVENREAGGTFGHENGHYGFGPVEEAKGVLEIGRLVGVTDSIRARGFETQAGPGAIQAIVLRSGHEHRYICANGHHRTSALAALGYASIPVSPRPGIVDRVDVLDWPGVKASVFTPDQALQVFDMLFEGRPPEPALRWWLDMQGATTNLTPQG